MWKKWIKIRKGLIKTTASTTPPNSTPVFLNAPEDLITTAGEVSPNAGRSGGAPRQIRDEIHSRLHRITRKRCIYPKYMFRWVPHLFPRHPTKYLLSFGVWMVYLKGPVIPNLSFGGPGCLGSRHLLGNMQIIKLGSIKLVYFLTNLPYKSTKCR